MVASTWRCDRKGPSVLCETGRGEGSNRAIPDAVVSVESEPPLFIELATCAVRRQPSFSGAEVLRIAPSPTVSGCQSGRVGPHGATARVTEREVSALIQGSPTADALGRCGWSAGRRYVARLRLPAEAAFSVLG